MIGGEENRRKYEIDSYWNVLNYAQVPIRASCEVGRKARRRNASSDFGTFVVWIQGFDPDGSVISIPFPCRDREGGEPGLIMMASKRNHPLIKEQLLKRNCTAIM